MIIPLPKILFWIRIPPHLVETQDLASMHNVGSP
jgi:hypothetical protein